MRRRYTFRLARLLHVRSLQEQAARGEWTAAEADALAAERREAALAARLADDRRRLGAELGCGIGTGKPPLAPAAVVAGHRALDAQLRGLALASGSARAARAHADGLAAAWRERERERRALAELSERGRARHRLALGRAEEADRDEQALQRRSAESGPGSSAGRPEADGPDGAAPALSGRAVPSVVPGTAATPPPPHPRPPQPR